MDQPRRRMPATGLLVRRACADAGPAPGHDRRSRAAALRSIVGTGDEKSDRWPRRWEQYLYEPDAAVLAAGLTATLAAEHSLAAITPGIAYLTGDQTDRGRRAGLLSCPRSAAASTCGNLRAALRQRTIGRLEIKKRGVDCETRSSCGAN